MSYKNHLSHSDKNFKREIVGALKNRLAGYWQDKKYPKWHYANFRGLKVALYDKNKVGEGYPDADLWVSWLCVPLEVKQERPVYKAPKQGGGKTPQLSDEQYYRAQLEDTEVFFRNHHTGLTMIVWEQNQVYDLICKMADLIFWLEGESEKNKLPQGSREFMALFFPRTNGLTSG